MPQPAPFRRGVRPSDPVSLPFYLDRTFDDVARTTQQIIETIQTLPTGGGGSILHLDGGGAATTGPYGYSINGGGA